MAVTFRNIGNPVSIVNGYIKGSRFSVSKEDYEKICSFSNFSIFLNDECLLNFSTPQIQNPVDDGEYVTFGIIERNSPRVESLSSNIMEKAIKFSALSFTDEQALEVPDLYPAYEVDHAYKKDERFTYNGRLFKVNQDHTSAAQWVPGETGTESLYTCLEMAGDGYLVWTQPTGAHNAYNTGDIVHYPTADDPLYKSLIDGNTTVPGSDERWWETYTAE